MSIDLVANISRGARTLGAFVSKTGGKLRVRHGCLTLAFALLSQPACDNKRLCDDGACDAPPDTAASDARDGATPLGPTQDASREPSSAGGSDGTPPDAGRAFVECSEDHGCPAADICHPELDVCVECAADEHCSEARPFCFVRRDPVDNRCVGCRGPGDCGGMLCIEELCVACDVDSGAGCAAPRERCVAQENGGNICVECSSDDHCSDSARPVCEPTSGTCVACLADGRGCPADQKCLIGDEQVSDAGDSPSPRCVECTVATAEQDCRAARPFCVQEQCVVCDPESGDGCDNTRPFCRTGAELATEVTSEVAFPAAVCAACREDEDCVLGNSRCVAGQCSECLDDADCSDPRASACDPSSHTCVGCNSSSQCRHVESANVCNVEPGSDEGRCVECNALDFRACDQAKNVCVTAPTAGQFTCSDRPVNQVGVCGECVADADCGGGQRCVFQSAAGGSTEGGSTGDGAEGGGSAGYYCLLLEGSNDAPPSCGDASAEPFIRRVQATSVDGVSGTYCTLDTTTCAVFVHFKELCSSDEHCGDPDEGAYCSPTQPERRCSYACGGHVDCPPSNRTCVSGYCSAF